MKQRQNFGYNEKHDLPSRFWEPGAGEEHEQEATELWMDALAAGAAERSPT